MRNCLIIKELLKAGITALIKFQRDLFTFLEISEEMKKEEASKKKKIRTETIYNVELERKLLTEHHFEKAILNLQKLSKLPSITTVEIVLDTIQSSLELALFGCKVEVAVITDAKQRTLEFYGDKNYNRKVQRGESGCFKAIDSREIVVEIDHSQATIVFVPLIGPTLVHGVIEIRGLVTNEVVSVSQFRRPMDAVRIMLSKQDYNYIKSARFWKSEKVAHYAKLEQFNSYIAISGRIDEVVYTKNGVPFFGGPRFNILWEDGKLDTELTAGELLNVYQETPQSLGYYTILDAFINEKFMEYSLKAGQFLETRKTEIFLAQLTQKLKYLPLNSVGIIEMILQSLPNVILGMIEIVFIGYNYRLNEMKSLISYSPIAEMEKEKEKANKKNNRNNNNQSKPTVSNTIMTAQYSSTPFDIAQGIMKDNVTEVYGKADLFDTIWSGIELKVPDKFQWNKTSDFNRFFVVFQKRLPPKAILPPPPPTSTPVSTTPAPAPETLSTPGTTSTGNATNRSRSPSPDKLPPTGSPTPSSLPRKRTRTNSFQNENPSLLQPFDQDIFLGAIKQIEGKVNLIWKLETRKRNFREILKNLETILLETRNLSLQEIYTIFLDNIPQKWLRADIYIGLLKSGGQIIDFISCNEHSKMLGKSIKKGEGISFDIIDHNNSLIFNQNDLDKKKQLSEGSLIGILYGKKIWSGKLMKFRGHEKYDVYYDYDQKIEVGVDISRIIPMNQAFKIKLFPKAKLPYIGIPIRNRNKCFGVLGVDNIDVECLIDDPQGMTSTPKSKPPPVAGAKGKPNQSNNNKKGSTTNNNNNSSTAMEPTGPTIDEDLKIFLEQLGKQLGNAIDLKLKKNCLTSLYTVAKNQNAEIKDLITSTLENIFSVSAFITGIIFTQFNTFNPTSLIILDQKGSLNGDLLTKISFFEYKKFNINPAVIDSSNSGGSKSKYLHKVGNKSVLLLIPIKSDDEMNPDHRLYVIGISCNQPITDVDYEFFNSLQKTISGLLTNIITHKASSEFRARALKDVRLLCNIWSKKSIRTINVDINRQIFFDKFSERIWKVYHSANLYVGIIGMHSNIIRYILASNQSEMKGKILIRSSEQSVSFIPIDKDKPLIVLQNSLLGNQLYHFGEKTNFQFPFVVVPIIGEMDSMIGILGIDNCAGEMISETSAGQIDDLLSFYGTVGLSLGKVIRRFRSEDVKKQLKELSVTTNNFHEAIILIRRVLLEFLPFANRVVDLSYRPLMNRVILEKEMILFMKLSSLSLHSLISLPSGILRLVMIYRGQTVGELKIVTNSIGNASAGLLAGLAGGLTGAGGGGGLSRKVRQITDCIVKIIIPEGVATDNLKIIFKLFHQSLSSTTTTSSTTTATTAAGNKKNAGPGTSSNTNNNMNQLLQLEKELSTKFLNLHYFLHSPLLPHVHNLYGLDDKSLAEIGSFQLLSKIENATKPIAILIHSFIIKFEYSSNIMKMKNDYQIYCLISWKGNQLGKTECYSSLETRIEYQDLEIFLPLTNQYQVTPLEIEIWSIYNKTKEDLLGKINLHSLLFPYLESRNQKENNATTSPYLSIQRNVDCLSFINHLSMKINGSIITAKELSDDKIGNILKSTEHAESSNLIPIQLQKSIKNLDNFLQAEISIHEIRDLLLLERYGNMATFFSISLNNTEIGSTSICYDANKPHWNDEYFRILIPTGREWEECSISLTLYAILGNATEAVIIGKLIIRSILLAEFLLSGIYKRQWFDLIIYNQEAFQQEKGNNGEELFIPQVLISGRILTTTVKPIIPSLHELLIIGTNDTYLNHSKKLIDFIEIKNLSFQFLENSFAMIIGYWNELKIMELKYSGTGSYLGKCKNFRLPSNQSVLLDSSFKIEFHHKITSRSSFLQTNESTLIGILEIKGIELIKCFNHSYGMVKRWFPIPADLYHSSVFINSNSVASASTSSKIEGNNSKAGGADSHKNNNNHNQQEMMTMNLLPEIGFRFGNVNEPEIYEYDHYVVLLNIIAAKRLFTPKTKFFAAPVPPLVSMPSTNNAMAAMLVSGKTAKSNRSTMNAATNAAAAAPKVNTIKEGANDDDNDDEDGDGMGDFEDHLKENNDNEFDNRPHTGCFIYWNSELIGKTSILPHSSDPLWYHPTTGSSSSSSSSPAERFILRVPIDPHATSRLSKCHLRIEIHSFSSLYSYESKQLLGFYELKGIELEKFFHSFAQLASDFDPNENNHNSSFKSTNTLSTSATASAASPLQQLAEIPWYPIQLPPNDTLPNPIVDELPAIKMFGSVGNTTIPTEIVPILPKDYEFLLQIHSATNLSNADAFGSANAYVEIFFMGKLIGFTQMIAHTMNPIYQDEIFFLPLSEVKQYYDKLDHHRSKKSNKSHGKEEDEEADEEEWEDWEEEERKKRPKNLLLRIWALYLAKPRAYLGGMELSSDELLKLYSNFIENSQDNNNSKEENSKINFEKELIPDPEFTPEENSLVSGHVNFSISSLSLSKTQFSNDICQVAILQVIAFQNIPRSSLLNTIPKTFYRILRRYTMENPTEWIEIYRSIDPRTSFNIDYLDSIKHIVDILIPIDSIHQEEKPFFKKYWQGFEIKIELMNQLDELIGHVILKDEIARELFQREQESSLQLETFPLIISENYALIDNANNNTESDFTEHPCEIIFRTGKKASSFELYLSNMRLEDQLGFGHGLHDEENNKLKKLSEMIINFEEIELDTSTMNNNNNNNNNNNQINNQKLSNFSLKLMKGDDQVLIQESLRFETTNGKKSLISFPISIPLNRPHYYDDGDDQGDGKKDGELNKEDYLTWYLIDPSTKSSSIATMRIAILDLQHILQQDSSATFQLRSTSKDKTANYLMTLRLISISNPNQEDDTNTEPTFIDQQQQQQPSLDVLDSEKLNNSFIESFHFMIQLINLQVKPTGRIGAPLNTLKPVNLYLTIAWSSNPSQILAQTLPMKETEKFSFDAERIMIHETCSFTPDDDLSTMGLLVQVYQKNNLITGSDTLLSKVIIDFHLLKEILEMQKRVCTLNMQIYNIAVDSYHWRVCDLQILVQELPNYSISPFHNLSLPLLPTSMEEYELIIFGFSGLPKLGRLLSSTDCYAVITYGIDHYLGETSIIPDSINPVWWENQSFTFRFPIQEGALNVVEKEGFDIYIDVYSANKSNNNPNNNSKEKEKEGTPGNIKDNKGIYLGSVHVLYEEIMHAVKDDKQISFFNKSLQFSEGRKKKILLQDAYNGQIQSINGRGFVGIARKEIIGIESKDFNIWCLNIRSLPSNLLLQSPALYVVVRWNGKIVGISSIAKISLNNLNSSGGGGSGLWGNNEKFSIHLSDPEILKYCLLTVELWWSKSSNNSNLTSLDRKKDLLLGILSITKDDLVNFIQSDSTATNAILSTWMDCNQICSYLPESYQSPELLTFTTEWNNYRKHTELNKIPSPIASMEMKAAYVGLNVLGASNYKNYEIDIQSLENIAIIDGNVNNNDVYLIIKWNDKEIGRTYSIPKQSKLLKYENQRFPLQIQENNIQFIENSILQIDCFNNSKKRNFLSTFSSNAAISNASGIGISDEFLGSVIIKGIALSNLLMKNENLNVVQTFPLLDYPTDNNNSNIDNTESSISSSVSNQFHSNSQLLMKNRRKFIQGELSLIIEADIIENNDNDDDLLGSDNLYGPSTRMMYQSLIKEISLNWKELLDISLSGPPMLEIEINELLLIPLLKNLSTINSKTSRNLLFPITTAIPAATAPITNANSRPVSPDSQPLTPIAPSAFLQPVVEVYVLDLSPNNPSKSATNYRLLFTASQGIRLRDSFVYSYQSAEDSSSANNKKNPNKFQIYFPLSAEFHKSFFKFEIWNKSIEVAAPDGRDRHKISELYLSPDMLLRFFVGTFTFPLVIFDNGDGTSSSSHPLGNTGNGNNLSEEKKKSLNPIDYYWKAELTMKCSIFFPYWHSCQMIRPHSYRRRIVVLSATNLPLINGVAPNSRATISMNSIAIAKSSLVSSNCHPNYLHVVTDLDIDLSNDSDDATNLSLTVEISHFNTWNRKEILIGYEEIPFEYLMKPPIEPLYLYLRNDTKKEETSTNKEYQFALSGAIKIMISGTNQLDEDHLSFYCREKSLWEHQQQQQQQQQLQVQTSAGGVDTNNYHHHHQPSEEMKSPNSQQHSNNNNSLTSPTSASVNSATTAPPSIPPSPPYGEMAMIKVSQLDFRDRRKDSKKHSHDKQQQPQSQQSKNRTPADLISTDSTNQLISQRARLHLSENELFQFGCFTNLSSVQENYLQSNWLLFPVFDKGLAIGNPKRKHNLQGTLPGNMLAFGIERRKDRLAISDISLLQDISYEISTTLNKIRNKDIAKRQRDKALSYWNEQITNMNKNLLHSYQQSQQQHQQQLHFNEKNVFTLLKMILKLCFPYSNIRFIKLSKDFSTLTYENIQSYHCQSFYSFEANPNKRRIITSHHHSKSSSSASSSTGNSVGHGAGGTINPLQEEGTILKIPAEYSLKDSLSFGRNFQRSILIENHQELLKQNLILFQSFFHQSFPRIQANICSEDSITSIIQLENFNIFKNGLQFPIHSNEMNEIMIFLEKLSNSLGDLLFLAKELSILQSIDIYLKQWNSSFIDLMIIVLYEMNKILFGSKFLEIINIDKNYKIYSLLEKSIKLEKIIGKKLKLKNIKIYLKLEELQSTMSTSTGGGNQSITASIKSFFLGGGVGSNATSNLTGGDEDEDDDDDEFDKKKSKNLWSAAKNLFTSKEELARQKQEKVAKNAKDMLSNLMAGDHQDPQNDEEDVSPELAAATAAGHSADDFDSMKGAFVNPNAPNSFSEKKREFLQNEGGGATGLNNLVCGLKYDGLEQIYPIRYDHEKESYYIPLDVCIYMKTNQDVFISIYEVNEKFQPIHEYSGMLHLSNNNNNAATATTSPPSSSQQATRPGKSSAAAAAAASKASPSSGTGGEGAGGGGGDSKIILSSLIPPSSSKIKLAKTFEFLYSWEYDELSQKQSLQNLYANLSSLEGFRLKLLKGNNLSLLKGNKLPSPFIEIQFNEKIITSSSIMKNSIAPEWNESIFIPFDFLTQNPKAPISNKNMNSKEKNRLILDCYDSSSLTTAATSGAGSKNKGTFLGRIQLSFEQLLSFATDDNAQQNILEFSLDRRKDWKPNKQKNVQGRIAFTCQAMFGQDQDHHHHEPSKNKTGSKANEEGAAAAKKKRGSMDANNNADVSAMFSQINQMKNPSLVLTIDSATELPSANRFSSDSDPFVVMFVGKEEISKGKTKVISNTLNPIWDENFTISLIDAKQNQNDINLEEMKRLQEEYKEKEAAKQAAAAAAIKMETSKSMKNPQQQLLNKVNIHPFHPPHYASTQELLEMFDTNVYERSAAGQNLLNNNKGTEKDDNNKEKEKEKDKGKDKGKDNNTANKNPKKAATTAAAAGGGGDKDNHLFLSDYHFHSLHDLPTIRFEVYDYNQLTASILLGKCEFPPQQYLSNQFQQPTASHQDQEKFITKSSSSHNHNSNHLLSGEMSIPLNEIMLSLSGFKNDFKNIKGKLIIKWKIIDLQKEEDEEEDEGKEGDSKDNKKRKNSSSHSTQLKKLSGIPKDYSFNEYNGLSLMSLIEINLFKIHEIPKLKKKTAFFNLNHKINSYCIIKYQGKPIHQTKIILNNSTPEYNEKCSFLFNYSEVYSQIIAEQIQQNQHNHNHQQQLLNRRRRSKMNSNGIIEEDFLSDELSPSSSSIVFDYLLDVVIELWLTDYFNNHECVGEFYIPSYQLLHPNNYEMITLELIPSEEYAFMNGGDEGKNNKKKEKTVTEAATTKATSDTEEGKENGNDDGDDDGEEGDEKDGKKKKSTTKPKRNFFSLTKQRKEDDAKRQIKTELFIMINHFRKFPEIHIQKRKYYPIYNKYEYILKQSAHQKAFLLSQILSMNNPAPSSSTSAPNKGTADDGQSIGTANKGGSTTKSVNSTNKNDTNNPPPSSSTTSLGNYLHPDYKIIGKPITMIYDPSSETNRFKQDKILNKMNQMLEKSNQQLNNYYNNPFEQLGIISELHYGQICAASRRGEKTILKGPNMEIFCLPLYPNKQSFQQRLAAQRAKEENLKKLRNFDPKSLQNDYLLQIENNLFSQKQQQNDDDSVTSSTTGLGGMSIDDASTTITLETGIDNQTIQTQGTINSSNNPAAIMASSPHAIQLFQQFNENNHLYLCCRYPKEQLPRRHIKALEKFQLFLLNKIESIFFERFSKQKLLIELYENMKKLSQVTFSPNNFIRLDDILLQSLLEFEVSLDCPIKLYLLMENGIDFTPVSMENYATGGGSIVGGGGGSLDEGDNGDGGDAYSFGGNESSIFNAEKSISTKYQTNASTSTNQHHQNRKFLPQSPDHYDLIAKVLLICRYQIIIQYYQNEISIIKNNWKIYLPNDLPSQLEILPELMKLFTGYANAPHHPHQIHTKQQEYERRASNRHLFKQNEGREEDEDEENDDDWNDPDDFDHGKHPNKKNIQKERYHFQNDYYQEFFHKEATFFLEVFQKIREQYPNGVLFMPLLAYNEMMVGLLIIKNINLKFPKVQYHYEIPQEYNSYDPNNNNNNNKVEELPISPSSSPDPSKKPSKATTTNSKQSSSNEKLLTKESIEHGVVPIINKSVELFTENIFITKLQTSFKIIRSFSIKAKTSPIKFILFCFYQLLQCIPAIRELSIWVIHKNHSFIEKEELLTLTNPSTSNADVNSVSNHNPQQQNTTMKRQNSSEEKKDNENDDGDDEDEDQGNGKKKNGKKKAEEKSSFSDPLSFLAKLFGMGKKMKGDGDKNNQKKKNKKNKKAKKIPLNLGAYNNNKSKNGKNECILSGFFQHERVQDFLQLEIVQKFKSPKMKEPNFLKTSSIKGKSTMSSTIASVTSIDSQEVLPINEDGDWTVDIPEVFQHWKLPENENNANNPLADENENNSHHQHPLRHQYQDFSKFVNKYLIETVYREIIYCIEKKQLITFPIMTGQTLTVIGKDNAELHELFTQQVFELDTPAIDEEKLMILAPTTTMHTTTTPAATQEENNTPAVTAIEGSQQILLEGDRDSSNSKTRGLPPGVKRPPLPPGPPPSYAARVTSPPESAAAAAGAGLSPFVSPRPSPSQLPGDGVSANTPNTLPVTGPGVAQKTSSTSTGDGHSQQPLFHVPAPVNPKQKEQYYFCLTVKTHGVGGDSGWGNIGEQTEKALATVVSLMEANLLKLYHLQKEQKEKDKQKDEKKPTTQKR